MLDQELRLQRAPSRSGKPDELDQLVAAINGMRLRIREDMGHRHEAEQELLFRKTLLECVLEAGIDGICIVGEDNICLFGNSHFRSRNPALRSSTARSAVGCFARRGWPRSS